MATLTQTEINSNLFLNIVGNETTVVKEGSGVLRGIMINNNTTGGTITIYDNIEAEGTKLATLYVGALEDVGPEHLSYMCASMELGITIVTAGSASNDITVFYV